MSSRLPVAIVMTYLMIFAEADRGCSPLIQKDSIHSQIKSLFPGNDYIPVTGKIQKKTERQVDQLLEKKHIGPVLQAVIQDGVSLLLQSGCNISELDEIQFQTRSVELMKEIEYPMVADYLWASDPLSCLATRLTPYVDQGDH